MIKSPSRPRARLAALIGGCAAAAMSFVPVAASADRARSVEELKSGSSDAYCTVILPEGSEHCESTLNAHIAWLTKGRITDIQSERDLTADRWKEVGQKAATYVVGRFWEDHDFKGNSQTYTAARGCKKDGKRDFEVKYVGGKWNDEFGSFKGYSNCVITLYEDANFQGARTPTRSKMARLGALNDKGSSITFG